MGKSICKICVCQQETDTFIVIIWEDPLYYMGRDENVFHSAPQGYPLCTGKYPYYYSGIFYQLL